MLPGLALGVVTMLVPKFLPKIGTALSPVVKSTVRGAYRVGQKTKEVFAEAEEHVHDIVAEVNAEDEAKAKASTGEATRMRAANASAARLPKLARPIANAVEAFAIGRILMVQTSHPRDGLCLLPLSSRYV